MCEPSNKESERWDAAPATTASSPLAKAIAIVCIVPTLSALVAAVVGVEVPATGATVA